jgi:DNA-binding LytR/AlgR family response regulator
MKLIAELAPDFEVINVCDSIESGVQYLKSDIKPELILLDIQLGDGLSFEIFKQVDVDCPVIFTTAYDEYVFRAFELNSIDYLMKPVHREELAKSIDKFRKLRYSLKPDWQWLSSLVGQEKETYKQRFLVSSGASLVSVKTSEAAYFYSVEKSTFLVTESKKHYDIEFSLDKLESMLSPKDFFRVNRQFLVSFSSIRKINILSKSRMKIVIEPAFREEIFVSNARSHEFRLWLDR